MLKALTVSFVMTIGFSAHAHLFSGALLIGKVISQRLPDLNGQECSIAVDNKKSMLQLFVNESETLIPIKLLDPENYQVSGWGVFNNVRVNYLVSRKRHPMYTFKIGIQDMSQEEIFVCDDMQVDEKTYY